MQTTFLTDETKPISGFNGLENRQILLNIMRDIGLFDDINETYITFIKNDLDDKINAINQHKNSTDTTVKLNKRVITEMMTEINKYKNNVTSKTGPNKIGPSKTEPIIKKQISFKIDENNTTSDENLITSLDIRSHKLETFEKDVTRTKEDFNKFNKMKLPNNIEFTIDVNDKPDQSEMINLYNKAILLRDQDLNVEIPEDSKKVGSKWINRELNTTSDLENIQKLQNKYLKISKEDAKLDNVIIQKLKVEQKIQAPKIIQPSVREPSVKELSIREPSIREPNVKEEDFNKKRVSFDDNFLLKMKEKYVKNEEIVLGIENVPNVIPNVELSMDQEIKFIKNQLQLVIENQNQILSMLKK